MLRVLDRRSCTALKATRLWKPAKYENTTNCENLSTVNVTTALNVNNKRQIWSESAKLPSHDCNGACVSSPEG